MGVACRETAWGRCVSFRLGALNHMEGTRGRIVDILQQDGAATVDGLSKGLGLAPATVRRHLDILQRDRIVTFVQVRKKTGRPGYSFSLTETGHDALPKGYDVLLSELVEELGGLDSVEVDARSGSELLQLTLTRIGERVAAGYRRGKGDVVQTLRTALDDWQLTPELEQREGALHIRVLNCPFRSVARSHKIVCTFCRSLISGVVGPSVRQEAGIALGRQHCSYVVQLEGINGPAVQSES